MALFIFIMIFLSQSTAFADTYERVNDKTASVTKTIVETIDINALKSNRQSLQTSCNEQLAFYDAQILSAKNVGVE